MNSLLDDRDEGGHIRSELLVGVVRQHVASRERYSGAWRPVWLHLGRSRCEVVHPGCPAFPKATNHKGEVSALLLLTSRWRCQPDGTLI